MSQVQAPSAAERQAANERRLRSLLDIPESAIAALQQPCAVAFLDAWLSTASGQLRAASPRLEALDHKPREALLDDLCRTAFTHGCRAYLAIATPRHSAQTLAEVSVAAFDERFQTLLDDAERSAAHLELLNSMHERRDYLEACVALTVASVKKRLTSAALPLPELLPLLAQAAETGFHVELMLWQLASEGDDPN